MATDVLGASQHQIHSVYSSNGPATVGARAHEHLADEYAELEKIVRLRDEIFSGSHPRFKPLPGTLSAFSHRSQNAAVASPASSSPAGDKQHQVPHVPAPTVTNSIAGPSKSQGYQISGVLLQKSDVLIKAENNLKRDRIERELRQQLENKLNEDRHRVDGRGGDPHVGDLDVDSVLTRAQIMVNVQRGHRSPSSATSFAGKPSIDGTVSERMSTGKPPSDEQLPSPNRGKESNDSHKEAELNGDRMDIDQIASQQQSIQRQAEIPNPRAEKDLDSWTASVPLSARQAEKRKARSPPPENDEDSNDGAGGPISRGRQPVDKLHRAMIMMRNASIRERPPVPPPAAQEASRIIEAVGARPAREPATLTAQDSFIDLSDDGPVHTYAQERGRERGRERERPPLDSRRSSNVYIKPEPMSGPSSVLGSVRRSPSLERDAGRREAREHRQLRKAYYEYPEPHPYYAHALAPLPHPAYVDPYYASPYPPPPPLEYGSRAYARLYPPPAATYALYEDYDRVYRAPPPPEPATRRPERRTPSPRRGRRSSRSVSPGRVERMPSMAPTLAPARAQSLAPPVRREYYERPLATPIPAGRYIDPYAGYYLPYPPRERAVFYDERDYYSPQPRPLAPPLPHHFIAPDYRERDYQYPPALMAPPPPRPYAAVEYIRDMELGRARSVIPEGVRGAQHDYIRSVSIRAAERPPGAEYQSQSARPVTALGANGSRVERSRRERGEDCEYAETVTRRERAEFGELQGRRERTEYGDTPGRREMVASQEYSEGRARTIDREQPREYGYRSGERPAVADVEPDRDRRYDESRYARERARPSGSGARYGSR